MLFLAKYIHTITIKIVTKIKHTDLRTVVTFGEGSRGTNSDEPQRHHTAVRSRCVRVTCFGISFMTLAKRRICSDENN